VKNVISKVVERYLYQEKICRKTEIMESFSNMMEKEQDRYKLPDLKLKSSKEGLKSKLDFDRSFSSGGIITGTDEVGRGCLFGPVFTATVKYNPCSDAIHSVLALVDDSKKLTADMRKSILFHTLENNIVFSLGFSTVDYIERNNILSATVNAVRMSLAGIGNDAYHLIDGKFPVYFGSNAQAVTKGDSQSFAIGLASIIAKAVRDYLIIALSDFYPGYCLEKNMGYGTNLHYSGIDSHGPTELHRLSFLKGYFLRKKQGSLIKRQEINRGF